MVAVLEHGARSVEIARAEIDGEHRLGAGLLAPFDEFVGADRVRFERAPRKIETDGPLGARADAVFPIVGGDEVAARIADQRQVQVANEFQHVAAKAVVVGGLVAGLVDAAVDGAAEVLQECAVDAVVDRCNLEILVNRNPRLHALPPPPIFGVSGLLIYILLYDQSAKGESTDRPPARAAPRGRRGFFGVGGGY